MNLGGYYSITNSAFNTRSKRIFNGFNGKKRWVEFRSVKFYD